MNDYPGSQEVLWSRAALPGRVEREKQDRIEEYSRIVADFNPVCQWPQFFGG